MARRGQSREVTEFSTSDEIITWLESLTGFLAHIDARYGGVAELLEHPEWDASQSRYAIALLKGLEKDISQATKEFSSHVDSYEKVVR